MAAHCDQVVCVDEQGLIDHLFILYTTSLPNTCSSQRVRQVALLDQE